MNKHCFPDLAEDKFEDIDFGQVLNEKRRFLCLDLDNTLLPQKGHLVSPAVKNKLEEIRNSGAVQDISLISNVIVPGHRVTRLRRLADELRIDHIVPGFFWNRKPKAAPFLKALSLMNAKAEECVMVGDQIFSDILGGNRLGFYTIWLRPMSGDHWSTLLVGRRRREKPVLEEMKRRGMI